MTYQRQLFIFCLCGVMLNLLNGCGGRSTTQEGGEHNKKVEIYVQLGVEYMRREQMDMALNNLKRALSIDSSYPEAHSAIAVLYEKIGQTEQARHHYEQAIGLSPSDSDTQNNYGQFLCKQERWQEAEQHFAKALENPVYRTPEIPATNAGMCALRNKDYAKAEGYLRKVLQVNPRFPLALYHMAEISYDTKRYMSARAYLQRYLAIAKHTPQTLWLGIRIERALNNRDAEASYIMLLRSQYPDSEPAQQLLNK